MGKGQVPGLQSEGELAQEPVSFSLNMHSQKEMLKRNGTSTSTEVLALSTSNSDQNFQTFMFEGKKSVPFPLDPV